MAWLLLFTNNRSKGSIATNTSIITAFIVPKPFSPSDSPLDIFTINTGGLYPSAYFLYYSVSSLIILSLVTFVRKVIFTKNNLVCKVIR